MTGVGGKEETTQRRTEGQWRGGEGRGGGGRRERAWAKRFCPGTCSSWQGLWGCSRDAGHSGNGFGVSVCGPRGSLCLAEAAEGASADADR